MPRALAALVALLLCAAPALADTTPDAAPPGPETQLLGLRKGFLSDSLVRGRTELDVGFFYGGLERVFLRDAKAAEEARAAASTRTWGVAFGGLYAASLVGTLAMGVTDRTLPGRAYGAVLGTLVISTLGMLTASASTSAHLQRALELDTAALLGERRHELVGYASLDQTTFQRAGTELPRTFDGLAQALAGSADAQAHLARGRSHLHWSVATGVLAIALLGGTLYAVEFADRPRVGQALGLGAIVSLGGAAYFGTESQAAQHDAVHAYNLDVLGGRIARP